MQSLEDLDMLIHAYRSRIQVLRTTRSNEAYYIRSRSHLQNTIEKLQKQLQQLEDDWANADSLIAEAKRQLRRCIKRRKRLVHAKQIEQLRKLQEQIKELGG